jgi:hypothetical protein
MMALLILVGLALLILKFHKFPFPKTFHLPQYFVVATRSLGPLKIHVHFIAIGRDDRPAAEHDAVLYGLASSAIHQWALSWDGEISPDTYAAIARLLRELTAPELRIREVIVASIALPDAPKPKETPAQRINSIFDNAVATVQAIADNTNKLSENKVFWKDRTRGKVIREMAETMRNKVKQYVWGH